MTETGFEKPIHYCYQCGSRIRSHMESCWYCGIPVRRQIRPPRRCPFCAEPIRPESIKCRHCGEFVDGRARVEARPIQQMIIIDKDLIRAMHDLQILSGSPVPDSVRNVLDAQTVQAIEANDVLEITQPGVRVLPMPAEQAGPGESKEIMRRPMAEPPAPRFSPPPPPARYAPPAEPPQRHETPPALPAPYEEPPAGVASKPEAVLDAEFSERYRLCDACKTEIFSSDNFCYYCGKKYRLTEAERIRKAVAERRRHSRNTKMAFLLFFLLAAVAGAYVYVTRYLPKDEAARIEEIARKMTRGNFAEGIEDLKNLSPLIAARKCRENLALLDEGKREAAAVKGLTSGTLSVDDVLQALKRDKMPVCPTSGTYTLHPLGQPPTCSIGDNGTTTTRDDHILRPEPPRFKGKRNNGS